MSNLAAAGKTDVRINITANRKKCEEEKELVVTFPNVAPTILKNAAKKDEKAGSLSVIFIDDILANASVNTIQDGLSTSARLLLRSSRSSSTLPCNAGLQDTRYSTRPSYLHSQAAAYASTNIEEADFEEDDKGGKEERTEERTWRKATTVASRQASLAAAAPVTLAAAPVAFSSTSFPVQQQQPSAALNLTPVADLREISSGL